MSSQSATNTNTTSIALAVIPARGGSKRVPGKNIRALCGRPAIAYSIDAARESGLFARVIVSTDSELIAEIAMRHGAEVPFLRAPVLADDHVPVSAATVDALTRLDPDRATFTSVAQLMPNCPLRDAADVRDSFRQFVLSGARSQLSVARYGWQPPWWAMRRTPELSLVPLFPQEIVRRSQDLPSLFCPTGAIWWAQADVLRDAGTYHIEGRTGWELDPTHGLDIDTEEDWQLAEALMEHRHSAAIHGAGLHGEGHHGAGLHGAGVGNGS
jgi:CMP-N-acetylneuraminic acid synthetase